MRLIVSGKADPYEAGLRIWQEALSQHLDPPDLMHPTWLIWGALTDWVEEHPDESERVHALMRRASQEWLLLADDEGAQRAYLERWVYEELGYERPRGR